MPESENVRKSSGHPPFKPEDNPKPFTSENQPSNEAKREGIRRYWSTRDLLNHVAGKFSDTKTDYVKLTATFYKCNPEEVTVKMIMDFRQVEKAIKGGDTQAYKAVSDRAFGRPSEEQPIIIDQKQEERNEIVLPGGQKLKL